VTHGFTPIRVPFFVIGCKHQAKNGQRLRLHFPFRHLKRVSQKAETYSMSDDVSLTDPLDDDRRYMEELRSMSDVEILDHMRQMRDELRLDNGKLAHEQGLSDEYLDALDASIIKFEQAVDDERAANARLAEATRKMTAAADMYLEILDDQSEYPQIIDDSRKDKKGRGRLD